MNPNIHQWKCRAPGIWESDYVCTVCGKGHTQRHDILTDTLPPVTGCTESVTMEAGLLNWSVHTPQLILEILKNPGNEVIIKPLQIFTDILVEVATRAAQLNDPELNALMVRLACYEISDPYSPKYDREKCQAILAIAEKLKNLARNKEPTP